MSDDVYRLYHRKYGMIWPDEHFSLFDALEGNLTFYGMPLKDWYDLSPFIPMRYLGEDTDEWPLYQQDILEDAEGNRYLIEDGMQSTSDPELRVFLVRPLFSGSGLTLFASTKGLKRIGNRYEHPDLLKEPV